MQNQIQMLSLGLFALFSSLTPPATAMEEGHQEACLGVLMGRNGSGWPLPKPEDKVELIADTLPQRDYEKNPVPIWTADVRVGDKPFIRGAVLLGKVVRFDEGWLLLGGSTLLYDPGKNRYHEVSIQSAGDVYVGYLDQERVFPPVGFLSAVNDSLPKAERFGVDTNASLILNHLLGENSMNSLIWKAQDQDRLSPNALYSSLVPQNPLDRKLSLSERVTNGISKEIEQEKVDPSTDEGQSRLRSILGGNVRHKLASVKVPYDPGTSHVFDGWIYPDYKDVILFSFRGKAAEFTRKTEYRRIGPGRGYEFHEVTIRTWLPSTGGDQPHVLIAVGAFPNQGKTQTLVFEPSTGEYFVLPLETFKRPGVEATVFVRSPYNLDELPVRRCGP